MPPTGTPSSLTAATNNWMSVGNRMHRPMERKKNYSTMATCRYGVNVQGEINYTAGDGLGQGGITIKNVSISYSVTH